MVPTPGLELAEIDAMMADPLFQIVARLAKGPADSQDNAIALADLVECDFPGYAPIPLTLNLDEAVDEIGLGALSPQRIEWIAGTIVTAQYITHIYYTKTYNGAGVSLVSAIAFDNPIPVVVTSQQIAFEATVLGLFGGV